MIRYLWRGPVHENSWRRFLLYPDPACLTSLAQRVTREEGGTVGSLSEDFSAVVSSVRVGVTHKLTGPERLGEVNRALSSRLKDFKEDSLEFADLGASDGITTLKTVGLLRELLQVPVRAWLIDLYVRLHRHQTGLVTEFRTPDGSPVIVSLGRLGLQLSSCATSRDPVSRLVGNWYLRRSAFRRAMLNRETISLIHPRVSAEPGITVLEWSALQRNPILVGRVDLARASNILNLSYFSPAQIETAVSHLHAYLREGGLLIVSHSLPTRGTEIEHGSIWRKQGERLVDREDFGRGSEVAELVDRYAATVVLDREPSSGEPSRFD